MHYSDLFSPTKIKNELLRNGIAPKKSLGQNFLIDKNTVDKIITAADVSKENTVIEIGAGLGVLTAPLGELALRVIAYELDARLAPFLCDIVNNYHQEAALYVGTTPLYSPLNNVGEVRIDSSLNKGGEVRNIEIRCADARTAIFNLPRSIIVGNLPYYATGRILRQIFTSTILPERVVVTVQKEVGERLLARQGSLSLLGVAAQLYGEPKRIAILPKTIFFPRPSVDSMVVRIDKNEFAPIGDELTGIFRLVKYGFSNKRKLLASNLSRGLGIDRKIIVNALAENNLPQTARAQELSANNWRGLFCSLG